MHILIAPNAFKNSLTAQQAAMAIKTGLSLSDLNCTSVCFPIADGGDGTGSLIIEKLNGTRIETEVLDPLGRNIISSFGLIDNGKTAVIEMADASGLRLLKSNELNPMRASSYGTGQLIKAAMDRGAERVIVAMGGSATVDGGCGILNALGFRFLGDDDKELEAVPEGLINVKRIDGSNADERLTRCEIIILCDVDNMLLGPNGSAAVFGPQKGANATAVQQLDGFLSRISTIAMQQTGKDLSLVKYGGAAGGAAAGLHAFLNARLVNGIEYFLDLTDFNTALANAQILITGEGSLDTQTLQGKGPFGVANRAMAKGISVIGIAGKVPLNPDAELKKYFKILLAIGNAPTDLPDALQNTQQNLVRLSTQIGNLLSLKK